MTPKTDAGEIVDGAAAALVGRHALAFERQLNIGQHSSPGQKIVILGDVADLGVDVDYHASIVTDDAVRGRHKPGEHIQYCGLPAARGADEAEKFATA